MRSECISEPSRWAMMIVTRSCPCRRSALRIRLSVPASMAAVESSNTITAGFSISARAMVSRWRWPPDSDTPRSPTTVR